VGLDLGGIAKGHAVDRAAAAIRALGVRDALVVAGGDLVALGRSEAHEAWRVGVRSPSDPAGIVDVLDVSDAAVATSGDYERFFEWGGRRYHHILDPRTGRPVRNRAVWVAVGGGEQGPPASRATFAETLSTAFMVLPPEDVADLCRRWPEVEAWIFEERALVHLTALPHGGGWR
jgi:thiamine biosynthesis lipoprotein